MNNTYQIYCISVKLIPNKIIINTLHTNMNFIYNVTLSECFKKDSISQFTRISMCHITEINVFVI